MIDRPYMAGRDMYRYTACQNAVVASWVHAFSIFKVVEGASRPPVRRCVGSQCVNSISHPSNRLQPLMVRSPPPTLAPKRSALTASQASSHPHRARVSPHSQTRRPARTGTGTRLRRPAACRSGRGGSPPRSRPQRNRVPRASSWMERARTRGC